MGQRTATRNNAETRGFTIIELLIVIIIIAILAAITIVAYNGVTQKADQASAQAAVTQANKAILMYMTENNNTLPATLSVVGIHNTNSTQYEYIQGNGDGVYPEPYRFCVMASAGQGATYYIDDVTGAVAIGTCPHVFAT